MTSNIINYLRNRETERTNLANEQLRGMEHRETVRHNFATERIQEQHNRAMQAIQRTQAAETQRANRASEYIRTTEAKTNQRDAETRRMQTVNTYLTTLSAQSIERSKVAVQKRYNEGQLAVATARAIEERRHNQESEALTLRNLRQTYDLEDRKLQETMRMNVATQNLNRQKAEWEHLDTQERTKVQREGNWLQLAGTVIRSGAAEKAGSGVKKMIQSLETKLILGY